MQASLNLQKNKEIEESSRLEIGCRDRHMNSGLPTMTEQFCLVAQKRERCVDAFFKRTFQACP